MGDSKKQADRGKKNVPTEEVSRCESVPAVIDAAEDLNESGSISLRKVQWVKGAIWVLFLGLVYVMQSFFAVIFLTFVFSYIAHNVVNVLAGLLGEKRFVRKAAVVVTFAVFIFLFYSCGRFIVPNIINQARLAYQKLSRLSLDRQEDFDSIFLRAYGGIRYVFFAATDKYEIELADYRNTLETELDEGGLDVFRSDAAEIRRNFRDGWVIERGTEIYRGKEGAGEYAGAFEAELKRRVREGEFLPNRERLKNEKEQSLIRSLKPHGFESIKEQVPDWDSYIDDLIVDDLVRSIDESSEVYASYENDFRREMIRFEGEAASAVAKGTSEWDVLFREYYEGLSKKERSHDYDKFVALEKAKSQEELEKILGEERLSEEKLLADFQKDKEKEYADAIKDYEIVSNLDDATIGNALPGAARFLAEALEQAWNVGITLILSVFFSFIIVWDIPKLARTVRRLEDSRISDFYREIAPGLVSLGSLMGRAFQAQAIIAVINTLLTLAAMTIFDIQDRAFLCTIVFICSFIPVVGVILSSIPIALWALMQPGGGIVLAMVMTAAIVVIHFIESTVLNPKVMGDMLKLHPLLVLVILFVGEHFFGIWGLLLGVPVCVYIFRYVILKKTELPGTAAVQQVS
jgi:predicted PurR-regulated permease PerM